VRRRRIRDYRRFIDHENKPDYIVLAARWRDFDAVRIGIPIEEIDQGGLERFLVKKISSAADSLIGMLDDMMIWEPARRGLEMGGCRQ
jgi:hypothetical protein